MLNFITVMIFSGNYIKKIGVSKYPYLLFLKISCIGTGTSLQVSLFSGDLVNN